MSLGQQFDDIRQRAHSSECTDRDHDLLSSAAKEEVEGINAAFVVVMLEGPQNIADAASGAIDYMRAWGAALEELANATSEDREEKEMKAEVEREAGLAAGEAIGTFIEMSRTYLDRV
ncbi:hypothetical protein KBZ21_05300 [Streptomyces sp. A73]|nr:hypothetical protein [Streptomyces sp. A73]